MEKKTGIHEKHKIKSRKQKKETRVEKKRNKMGKYQEHVKT